MMKFVVLSCVVAMASAAQFAPLAYSAPYAYSYPGVYASPAIYAAPFLTPSNYRGPWSLAPGQPANILAADGRPLDTLEVNLDRYKTLTGTHEIKKRSAPLYASPLTYSYSSPALTTYSSPAFSAYSSPAFTSYSSPALTRYIGHSPYVHLIKKRSAPLIAPLVKTYPLAPAHTLYSSFGTYSNPALSTYIASSPFTYAQTPFFIKK